MQYLGDYKEDETVYFLWSTNDADGASVTRTADGTVSVYKDNGVSQSVAGVTDTEDFDSLTGIHACTIDLSADVFYATGADYAVVLSAATIDGQTVNAVLAHFSIENRFMRGTDSAALASSWTAALATILGNYTAARAGYLDELAAANLPTDIAAIPTTAMRGTDDAATEAKQDIIDANLDLALADTDELQTNQGNWATATGFATGIKKNTALSNFHFVMYLLDGNTAATGKTITAERLIDDGTYSACANSPVEESDGTYRIDLAASDLNGDVITFKFTEEDCRTTILTVVTN